MFLESVQCPPITNLLQVRPPRTSNHNARHETRVTVENILVRYTGLFHQTQNIRDGR